MTASLSLTSRDQEVLQALVQKVRLFSQRQVADHWFDGDIANARRRIKQYEAADLVRRISVQARTLPELTQPVASWSPGKPALDYQAVAYRLQSRWKANPVRPCTAIIATERLSQHYGGRNRGELKHPLQATHDLGVAQIWLHLDRQFPDWATAWRGEDLLAHTRRGEKCPDAFIVTETNDVFCVIEFGGAYSVERVREFCEDCAQQETPDPNAPGPVLLRGLPFQLW